MTNRYNKI